MGLVIERREGESVLVGRQIKVTLVAVRDQRIVLDIERTDGSVRFRRTLADADAVLELGPVRIQARRPRQVPTAKLTFAAPRHVAIARSELLAH